MAPPFPRPRPTLSDKGAGPARQGTGPAPAVRFEVLGPLRVWRGTGELDLGFPQQRALLALLLVRAGRPVPSGEIVEALWSGRPPASAAHVVRRYAGSLRRLLEPELPPRAPGRRVLRRGGGYLLHAENTEVDLLRFRDLVGRAHRHAAAGRPDSALEGFIEALSQWRGPVAQGVPEAVRAHPRFAVVEREIVSATATAADLALRHGGTARILPSVGRAVALAPLDESLHARLVLGLAAVGAQAEALAAYEAARHRLAAELGVLPGAELSAAHTRVLRRQVPRTRPAMTAYGVPTQLPPDLAVFTGRAAELATLTAAAAAADDATLTAAADAADAAGGAATVVIGGAAGAGKSTLAIHWAHTAAARFPDGRLHVELGGFDPVRHPLDPAEALRGMLVSLGVPDRGLPDTTEALTRLYRKLMAGRRALVVLDDAAGADQVRPLLPAAPGCLTLVTSRLDLSPLVSRGARPLRLRLPPAREAEAILARRIGAARAAAEPEAVRDIAARCGHLPLALAAVAARAVARPHFPLAALAGELRSGGGLDAFPAGVRTAFQCSCRALPPEDARLFRSLSRHPGPRITPASAAALTGLPVLDAGARLRALSGVHLLTESEPGAGPAHYTLHPLLRSFAAELADEQGIGR
ncbi:AfsR/SARP family transcriptional regulator [Streptomyces yaizuensis]|uniref:AfsR/SARP family transcriptional regulator n=1 Tax=Streptomyces yaizuensis TaxID=2989713 RepID=A0ABQ5NYC1_9ACTN|nr:BTAD domain-containing putative transcriptional regulator [Streptomyces sp. YSPA8]GLF95369.1 AfsR/SARP family transcriptional regulator [Streptomyces sp. YSPA8]